MGVSRWNGNQTFSALGLDTRGLCHARACLYKLYNQLKSHLPLKPKGSDLKFVHNANMNMLIAVSLSLSGSLYDLEKPSSKVRPRVGRKSVLAIISKTKRFRA